MRPLIARFSRAGTDDHTLEVEVEDIVFDFDCVEEAETGRLLARIEVAPQSHNGHIFVTDDNWFDTLTVVAKE